MGPHNYQSSYATVLFEKINRSAGLCERAVQSLLAKVLILRYSASTEQRYRGFEFNFRQTKKMKRNVCCVAGLVMLQHAVHTGGGKM